MAAREYKVHLFNTANITYITQLTLFYCTAVALWEFLAPCSQSFSESGSKYKKYFTMDIFETYYNYLTFDCCYLMKYNTIQYCFSPVKKSRIYDVDIKNRYYDVTSLCQ